MGKIYLILTIIWIVISTICVKNVKKNGNTIYTICKLNRRIALKKNISNVFRAILVLMFIDSDHRIQQDMRIGIYVNYVSSFIDIEVIAYFFSSISKDA